MEGEVENESIVISFAISVYFYEGGSYDARPPPYLQEHRGMILNRSGLA